MPRDLTEYMTSAYSALRQEQAQSDAPLLYTTARTLLSIIRLSEVCEFTLLWLHYTGVIMCSTRVYDWGRSTKVVRFLVLKFLQFWVLNIIDKVD